MRPIPVMLALLLALSPGAVATQASAPVTPAHAQTSPADGPVTAQSEVDTTQPPRDGNTTAVMSLATPPDRTEFDSPSLALGSSLAMNRDSFRTELSTRSLNRRLEAADSETAKQRLLNQFRYRIENRIISLKAKERQVTRSFTNGTISKSEYLRTLGQIDAEAEEIRGTIDVVKRHASTTRLGFDARSLKTKLVMLEGPVRNQIAHAMRGNAPQNRIYVAADDTGVVLSMIRNGQYVREVYRADNRNPSKDGAMEFEQAEKEIISSQFPWIVDSDNFNTRRQRQYSSLNVLRFIYFHSHGRFTAYIDTGTKKIYRTIQFKQLTGENSLPPGPGVSNSSDNLTLVVNRTYPGGPLRVNLTNETGAPLEGQIAVAGEPVGRTHADGTLWTLGLAEEFRVTATYRGRTVNVTTTPVNSS